MAKIAEYNTKVSPSQGQAMQTELSLYTSGGKMVSEVAGQLEGITQKFYDMKVQRDTMKASTDTQTALNQAEVAAANDPDPDNFEQHKQNINSIVTNSGAGISDKQAKALFGEKARLLGYNSYANIEATYRKKNIDAHKDETYRNINSLHEIFKDTPNKEQAELFRGEALSLTKSLRSKGYITAETARSSRDKINDGWSKDWQNEQIQGYVNSDPDLAESMIASGDFGDLDAKDKETWYTTIDRRKKQIAKKQKDSEKEVKDSYVRDLDDKALRGTLTMTDISKAYEAGVDPKTVKTKRDAMLSTQKKTLRQIFETYEESEDYIDVVDKQSNLIDVMGIKDEQDKYLASNLVIKAFGDGILSNEEGDMLMKVQDKAREESSMQQLEQGKGFSVSPLFNAYKTLKYWMYKHNRTTNDKAKTLRKFMLEASDSENPEEVANKIINVKKSENYPEYNGWETGKSYSSDVGTVKVIDKDDDGMPIVEMLNAN